MIIGIRLLANLIEAFMYTMGEYDKANRITYVEESRQSNVKYIKSQIEQHHIQPLIDYFTAHKTDDPITEDILKALRRLEHEQS